MSSQRPSRYILSPEGKAALEAELAELEGRQRRVIAERLKAARELGDLRENAEYDEAKRAQGFLEARIREIRHILRNAVVVENGTADAQEVGFGSTVTLADEEGRQETWTLVGSVEANPLEGKLSAESPLGKALLGRRAGEVVEVVTPRGTRRLRILAVR